MLKAVVGTRGYVLAQVPLKQLLWFPPGQDRSVLQTWKNKTDRRLIDFVVCEAGTLRPLVAIELDEPSQAEPRRQQRDEEVERILEAAGLPLIHVLTSRAYDTRELDDGINPYLPGLTSSAPSVPDRGEHDLGLKPAERNRRA